MDRIPTQAAIQKPPIIAAHPAIIGALADDGIDDEKRCSHFTNVHLELTDLKRSGISRESIIISP
jgi:hypothetical protein